MPTATDAQTRKLKPHVQRVRRLKKAGHTDGEIARRVGVERGTVARYFRKLDKEKQQLAAFDDYQAVALRDLTVKAWDVKRQLLESMGGGDYCARLSPDQKQRHLTALSIAAGVSLDKLRLVTNQSTQNVNLITQHYHKASKAKPRLESGVLQHVQPISE